MGHKDAGVFQAYINERVQCDVQAAFLGQPSSHALFKATSHMSRFADPRAPTELTNSDLDALRKHPEIIVLRQLRDTLSEEARKEFGTIQTAKANKSKIFQMYERASADLHCAKTKVRKSALMESREHFFDTIDTKDLNAQVDLSMLDIRKEDWKPQRVEHSLHERRDVVRLLCESPSQQDQTTKLEWRVHTIEALVIFCRVQEISACKKRVHDRTWGIVDDESTPKSDVLPMTLSNRQCLFCFRCFCRPRKAREHTEGQHLRQYKLGASIPCPHPVCEKKELVLNGHMHFKNHAAIIHNVFLFERCGR